jgi:two-component system, NtrC family, C4-dicarboxylate transport sensor histidine kinase DctB
MSQLALVSRDAALAAPSAHWAHDIRNALATVGLHLETLERLSGSRGRETAHAAYILMSRAASMCNEAIAQGEQAEVSSRRRPFDIVKTVVQIVNLLRPTAPEGFEIRVAGNGAFVVLADQQEIFRVLFNLVHNAIGVARQQTDGKWMTNVTLLVERNATTVTVRIADDGPGLPKAVRARLFRPQSTGSSGLGLAIARELAERSGGVLQHVDSARGTTFVLELSSPTTGSPKDEGALRSLGKRVHH